MKLLIILSLLLTSACSSKSGSNSNDKYAVDSSQIVQHEYETDELIIDFQTADLPGNSATVIEIKGQGLCSGRVLLNRGNFTLFNFVGVCSDLNGDYKYKLTTKCQGYSQTLYQCGNTSLIDIILQKH